jgi:hypothetical protein
MYTHQRGVSSERGSMCACIYLSKLLAKQRYISFSFSVVDMHDGYGLQKAGIGAPFKLPSLAAETAHLFKT